MIHLQWRSRVGLAILAMVLLALLFAVPVAQAAGLFTGW